MTSEMGDSRQYVPVGEFFSGRSVFVTGGTGFLGKVLVEKLLRSCPGIEAIYLLIRPKRGREAEDRLSSITNCALFDKLMNENPSAITKIVPVAGDISQPGLGLSASDWSLLTERVSVLFHCAATVNFDEPLKVAVDINMLGTRRVLEICQQMTQLQALIHVSTCYSNCDLEEVKEIVYPARFNPEDIVQCTKWMDSDLLAYLKPKLLGKHPNSYTFTKSLAENIVLKECGDIPVAIVRPSIVTSSWKDPLPGWIESLNGPTALVVAIANGVLRDMMCDVNKVTDIVPVDMVVSAIICAAWRLANERSKHIDVYNCSTGIHNPLTWDGFRRHLFESNDKYPFSSALWFPFCKPHKNRITYKIGTILTQQLPACVLDLLMKVTGKKPIFMKLQTKLMKGCQVLEFFTTREWRFSGDNMQRLLKRLQGEDRRTFQFDVRDIEWKGYLSDYLFGTRTYVAKQDPSSLPQALKHLQRLRWIHRFFQLALTVSVGYWLTTLLRLYESKVNS